MNAIPERTLIIGCGDLGIRVGNRLVAAGGSVTGARRRPEALPDAFQRIAFDVTDALAWDRVAGTTPSAIIYCVAADESTELAYRRAYLEGAQRLVETITPGGSLNRVVFVSSTSVYGVNDGTWIDERSPARPSGFRGEVLLEAERVLADSSLPVTTLRLAGLYGPGRTRLIEMVRQRGGPSTEEAPPTWTNRIHIDDAAAAITTIVSLDDAAPVYIGVDDEPSSRYDVLRFLASRLGAPNDLDLTTIPKRGSKRCRNDALRTTGWAPRYPTYREGYASMVDAERR